MMAEKNTRAKIDPVVRALYYMCIEGEMILPLIDNEAWEFIHSSVPRDDKLAPLGTRKYMVDSLMKMLLCR